MLSRDPIRAEVLVYSPVGSHAPMIVAARAARREFPDIDPWIRQVGERLRAIGRNSPAVERRTVRSSGRRPMHNRIAASCLAVLSLVLVTLAPRLGSEARAEQDWTTYTSKVGRFSVDLPGEPVETATQRHSFIGTIKNYIFTTQSGEDTYTIEYSDIPHFAIHFAGADRIYEHAKGALLKKTFGKTTSYVDVTVSGEKGKRLEYDTPPVAGHPEMRGDAILVLVGTRLYVIDEVVPEADADAKSQRFLSSVKITK
jgi:hypothetical protein